MYIFQILDRMIQDESKTPALTVKWKWDPFTLSWNNVEKDDS